MMSSAGSRRRGLLLAAACCATLAACGDTRDANDTGDTLAVGGDVAMSGDSAAGAAAAAMDVPTTDAGAVDLLTTIDRAEVEAGRLAQEEARDAQVSAFAREMIQTHNRDIRQVEQLSRQAAISTAGGGATPDTAAPGTDTSTTRMKQPGAAGTGAVTALHASHQATMERLRNLEGADFDSAYMSAMVSGHQQALDLLQRVENNVQNAQLA
jgi:putative membrane protein